MNTPLGMDTDHRDGNKLNNLRSNLRVCSHTDNLRNSSAHKDAKSIYKGVSPHKKGWRVQIRGKTAGNFPEERWAAMAYDIAAKEVCGDYARLNSPGALHG